MTATTAHLIVDFGTGNLRVAVITADGSLLGIAREDIPYLRDEQYPDSIYFEPALLWKMILQLTKKALGEAGPVTLSGISATSQREGIVVLDQEGNSIVGMPNIDHRGRQWESILKDKERVYQLTGRFPTSLFSAMKLVGLREASSPWWTKAACFLSISDWIEYMWCGVKHYEHSQASETLLYDVAQKKWSDELMHMFGVSPQILPPLVASGTILGTIHKSLAMAMDITETARVIVGGGRYTTRRAQYTGTGRRGSRCFGNHYAYYKVSGCIRAG